jgi:hypothetical protein
MVGAREPRSFMLWNRPFRTGKKLFGAEKEKFGMPQIGERARKKQRKRMNQYDDLKNSRILRKKSV